MIYETHPKSFVWFLHVTKSNNSWFKFYLHVDKWSNFTWSDSCTIENSYTLCVLCQSYHLLIIKNIHHRHSHTFLVFNRVFLFYLLEGYSHLYAHLLTFPVQLEVTKNIHVSRDVLCPLVLAPKRYRMPNAIQTVDTSLQEY